MPSDGSADNPASVQAVAAAPAELPDKSAGYDGVDAVLLRADAPLDSLSEAQTDALKAWVVAGGHLIVCGGADPTPLGNAFYNGLLPASIGPEQGETLGLTPKPLPGVRVVASDGGRPTVVEGPYGAGRVTLLADDTPTIRTWSVPRQAAFWKQALSGHPASSLLNVVAGREEAGGSQFYGYYGGGWGQLSDAVMRAPALDAPGADVVGLFLLAYVLILVPINYLVLKRLDKKEWSWVTVPALVVVFAVTTYGVGYAAKGNSVFVNRAAVVETTAGERQAGLYTEIGLFSPHRTTYDMSVADPNALAAIPVPPEERQLLRAAEPDARRFQWPDEVCGDLRRGQSAGRGDQHVGDARLRCPVRYRPGRSVYVHADAEPSDQSDTRRPHQQHASRADGVPPVCRRPVAGAE